MKLTKIHINHFGNLKDFDLTPEEGLNRIERPNGWGKSTLAAFLKAMLFGLPSARASEKNPRLQYAPWEGGSYGGYLELSCELGEFRIERIFDPLGSRDYCRVFDKATGLESDALGEIPGETLFGINADGFDKTAYLTQKDVYFTKGALSSITDRLHKLLDNVEDAGSFDDAIKTIHKYQKGLRNPVDGLKYKELEQQLWDLKSNLEKAKSRRGELELLEEKRNAFRDALDSLESVKEEFHRRREIAVLLQRRRALVAEIDSLNSDETALESVFRGAPLADEELAGLEESCRALQSAAAYAKTLRDAFPADEYERLLRIYPNGVPGEDEIAAGEEILRRRRALAEQLDANPEQTAEAAPHKGGLLIASILLLIGGALALPILFGAPLWLLAGAIPALLAGGAYLGFVLSKSAKSKHELAKREAERQALLNEISALDAAFYEKLPVSRGCSVGEEALSRLREDQRLSLALCKEKARLDEALAKQSELSKPLAALISTYATPEDRADPSALLARLRDTRRKLDWTRNLLAEKKEQLKAFDKEYPLSEADLASDPVELEEVPDWKARRKEWEDGLRAAEQQIALISAELDRIPEWGDALSKVEADLNERREKYLILERTEAYLEKAKDALSARYRDGIEQRFPVYLKLLAGEEMPEASVDSEMNIRLYGGGRSRSILAFSQGTKDLADVCLHLSLVDALTDKNEIPFLLLDDPFVNLDDRRYAAARRLLGELAKTHQIFYFVCRRERD